MIFLIFSIKFYLSDENIKKTFRNLSSIDKNINIYKSQLPIISNDTDNIVNYLTNDDNSNKKKYSFWDLLKSEN
tara:strand:+ start:92 stop:313 length:222 start_codon:yes stop_codon:yes gene_type:complete